MKKLFSVILYCIGAILALVFLGQIGSMFTTIMSFLFETSPYSTAYYLGRLSVSLVHLILI
ncbi:MAG: hypothetical protein KDC56_10475, partial [Flavobacteriaceae bacterium]|nr:hypothetical protein [Flavobacteriaceae bacterium]